MNLMDPGTRRVAIACTVIMGLAALALGTGNLGATPIPIGSFNWNSLNNKVSFALTVDDFQIVNGSVSARAYPEGATSNVIPGMTIGPRLHASSGSYGGDVNYMFLLFSASNTDSSSLYEPFYRWNPGSGGSLLSLPDNYQHVIFANLAPLDFSVPPNFAGSPGTSVEIVGTIVNTNPGWYLKLADGTPLNQGGNTISFGSVAIPPDAHSGDIIFSGIASFTTTRGLGGSAPYVVYVAPDRGSTLLLLLAGVGALSLMWRLFPGHHNPARAVPAPGQTEQ